jgi:hypothetical protein
MACTIGCTMRVRECRTETQCCGPACNRISPTYTATCPALSSTISSEQSRVECRTETQCCGPACDRISPTYTATCPALSSTHDLVRAEPCRFSLGLTRHHFQTRNSLTSLASAFARLCFQPSTRHTTTSTREVMACTIGCTMRVRECRTETQCCGPACDRISPTYTATSPALSYLSSASFRFLAHPAHADVFLRPYQPIKPSESFPIPTRVHTPHTDT